MPILAPLSRPLEGFDVAVFVLELEVVEDEEAELGVEVRVAVGVETDPDEVDVVGDTPIVAKSVIPSLRLQHVTLTPPQHHDPSLHCPTGTFVVGSPPL
jgi:hypothetical protein